jgi:hypothetical protein
MAPMRDSPAATIPKPNVATESIRQRLRVNAIMQLTLVAATAPPDAVAHDRQQLQTTTAPPAGVPAPSDTEVDAVQFGNGVTFSCPVAGCSSGAQGWSGSEFIQGTTPSCSKVFSVGPRPRALLLRGPLLRCWCHSARLDAQARAPAFFRRTLAGSPARLTFFTVRLDRPCSNPSCREPQVVLASFARCLRHLRFGSLGIAAQSVTI